MNFNFSEDQLLMKEEVKKLLDKENSVKRNRNILEGEEKFDKELWNQLVQMGLTATTIPEEYGGIGMGFLELCVIAEELGRGIAPVPFSSSVVILCLFLLLLKSHNFLISLLTSFRSSERVSTVTSDD